MRIKDLEFRKSIYLGQKPENPSYEVVRWYSNPHYGNEDKYIKEGDWYRDPNSSLNYRIHKDCFKNPESCYTIASFIPDRDGEYEIRFCGDRPLDPEVSWKDFYKILQYGNTYLNNSNNDILD